jgi:2-polyprenyl-3-methyl-5-hydroxy-6-metoxy-1,4-benzoquinol methylase
MPDEQQQSRRQQEEMLRALWTLGDYERFGELFAEASERLVERVGVAGLDVLDVATGTGNTAIAAATAGGRVTALDVTPELLDVARRRAAGAAVEVRWLEGNMEAMDELDLPDAGYDRVLSTFGTQYAADPGRMARELVRLCRPGGVVAVCGWTEDGALAKAGLTAGEIIIEHLPAAAGRRGDAAAVFAWGRRGPAMGFFGGLPVTVTAEPGSVLARFPSVEDAVEFVTEANGPMQLARRLLENAGSWPASRAAFAEQLLAGNVATDGTFAVELPYLTVLARRDGAGGPGAAG